MTQLIPLQSAITNQMTRLLSNFKKTSKAKITLGYVECRFELLEEYWTKYVQQNDEILKLIPIDEQTDDYFKQCAFMRTEDIYLDIKTLFKECLRELKNTEVIPTVPQQSSDESRKKTKLPPIELPKFNGDYKDWPSFKDLFISLIHNDPQLSNIERYHYLKSSLTGEAETLLKHLSLIDSNYLVAWRTLEQRYNNPRIIVGTILQRFLNQRKIFTENARSLKDLLDTTNECLNSLNNQKIKTDDWDPLVVHIVVSKLDTESHKEWEQSLGASQLLPTYKQLTEFLEGRFRVLEMIHGTTYKAPPLKSVVSPKSTNIKSFTAEINATCTYCSQRHYICHCKDFAEIDIAKRQEFVKRSGICFNCLVKGHTTKQCRQKTTCKVCHRRHHTLLHGNVSFTQAAVPQEASLTKDLGSSTSTANTIDITTPITSMKAEITSNQVILATAKIAVQAKDGATYLLRALVDQGSQASFVTEATAQLLGLKRNTVLGKVTGIDNSTVLTTKSMVTFTIQSIREHNNDILVNAYVLRSLSTLLPSHKFKIDEWPLLNELDLADPDLHKPSSIDVLLGAEVHAEVLMEGLHKHNSLIAQNSRLGWLVSGKATTHLQSHKITVMHTQLMTEVDQQLRKFWEVEEQFLDKKPMTLLEKKCEKHFKTTHTRDIEGRYIVKLPFQDDYEQRLGDSRSLALSRLLQMERKFMHKPEFKKRYAQFMDEYLTLNHMEEVKQSDKPTKPIYYLPHHAVLRESSVSTKLRVVFDGSAKPYSGTSLNDELLIGPPLQQDIRDLVIRWRQHKIGILADVKQMYRQILVSREDTDLQRILWRTDPKSKIKEFRLLTVTYGTSCAPYLAIRTLKQLADDEKEEYPTACSVLQTDFYVDDLLSGASNEDDAIVLQTQLTKLLLRAGLEMHKWSSNSQAVLKEIPQDRKLCDHSITIKMDSSIKALGIHWNPVTDMFILKLDVTQPQDHFTKTTVLSDIARIFDPLGCLSPVVITAKIFLQKLWLAGLNWKDPLPATLGADWSTYREKLRLMTVIHLPRWFGIQSTGETSDRIQLHGFCDASTAAYAAVVYLRHIRCSNDIHTSIIVAKSRVAPVKSISLPQLELCGAVLLSKLIEEVKLSLKIDDHNVFAYTDSEIVLCWLRKNPNTWKTFVANRTTEILNVLNSNQWHHVRSCDNPADCASRGISPESLNSFQLWWHGPSFLFEKECISYDNIDIPDIDLERNLKVNLLLDEKRNEEILSYLNQYSNINKLLRVTAYCLRFMKICLKKEKLPTYLTALEINSALITCIQLSQNSFFSAEINCLNKGVKLHKSSKLYTLNPFFDDKQVLRVGSRLCNAPLDYEMKLPTILAYDCNLSKLIVKDCHTRALHAGPQLTLNLVRKRYWIIGAKRLVKKVIRECLICFRHSATPITQIMGSLPEPRVTPVKPFRRSGVDYAGPITLKLYAGRCKRLSKAYICLFICMVTKAIHLELVTDLTSKAFLAAFKRFTSRHGHCSELWSDCGTNFVGASKELESLFKDKNSGLVHEIAELLANDKTSWHFIPPGSPHFGGLWEAGVKSIKAHLKRVIGTHTLTFEEYVTLLCQVEACVNSRPLTPISTSSYDDLPLTPSHFLIGESSMIPVEPSYENVHLPYLDRWQLVQRITQDLWKRWSSEYLTTLHNRYRWPIKMPEPELGSLVLIKDEHLPPGKWLLGRILKKHPGKDGLTRVVTLKFKDKLFQRPITKLCPLPSVEN